MPFESVALTTTTFTPSRSFAGAVTAMDFCEGPAPVTRDTSLPLRSTRTSAIPLLPVTSAATTVVSSSTRALSSGYRTAIDSGTTFS
jgi:hypothetical protein